MPRPLSKENASILHSLQEHTGLLLKVLVRGEAAGKVRDKLIEHVRLEEGLNLERARAVRDRIPEDERSLHERLVQHIEILREIASPDGQISPGLRAELLTHFAEEHAEYMGGSPAGPSSSSRKGATPSKPGIHGSGSASVGELFGQAPPRRI